MRSIRRGSLLFGSWARGEANEQSDLDFLVYSVSEIDPWEDSDYHVVGRALKEGKVLYESDRCAP